MVRPVRGLLRGVPGAGRGLGVERVLQLNEWALRGLVPDLTVVLDVDQDTAEARRPAGTGRGPHGVRGQGLPRRRERHLPSARRAGAERAYLVLDAPPSPQADRGLVLDRVRGVVPVRDEVAGQACGTVVGQPRVVEQLQRAAQGQDPTQPGCSRDLRLGPFDRGPRPRRRPAVRARHRLRPVPRVPHRLRRHARGRHELRHGEPADQHRGSPHRELVVKAQDRPSVGSWRIMIVEDADRMTERTSSVMLKSIEEPPPHHLAAVCALPMDVLVTIRSRCRAVTLKVPSAQDVAHMLVAPPRCAGQRAEQCARLAQCHVGVATRLALYDDARTRRPGSGLAAPVHARGHPGRAGRGPAAPPGGGRVRGGRGGPQRRGAGPAARCPWAPRRPAACHRPSAVASRLEADQKRRSRRIRRTPWTGS